MEERLRAHLHSYIRPYPAREFHIDELEMVLINCIIRVIK
jgi:hypothetical protein